jgi:hypothetical protein
MKKKTFIWILSLASLTICNVVSAQNSLSTKITTNHYFKTGNFKMDANEETVIKAMYEKQDSRGNIVEVGEYGEIVNGEREKISFDENMNIVKGLEKGLTRVNERLRITTFNSYDDKGRITKKEIYRYVNDVKDTLIYRTDYLYGSDDQLIKETEYGRSGKIIRSTTYLPEYTKLTATTTEIINETIALELEPDLSRKKGKREKKIKYIGHGADLLELERVTYFNGMFEERVENLFDFDNGVTTEVFYTRTPETISYILETIYNPGMESIKEEMWKFINAHESRDQHFYDKSGLRVKTIHFYRYNMDSYTTYEYVD